MDVEEDGIPFEGNCVEFVESSDFTGFHFSISSITTTNNKGQFFRSKCSANSKHCYKIDKYVTAPNSKQIDASYYKQCRGVHANPLTTTAPPERTCLSPYALFLSDDEMIKRDTDSGYDLTNTERKSDVGFAP